MKMLAATLVAACLLAAAPAAGLAVDPGPPGVEDALRAPAGEAGAAVPPRDAGGYRTPNRDLTAAEAVWHARVALNVAAIGCRGPGDAGTAPAYNALLAAERVALDAALAATRQRYRDAGGAGGGAGWEDRFDGDMTRLYNFWAQPGAHAEFCGVAAALLREAAVPGAGLAARAAAALARLEAPFTGFYAAVDAWRAALAARRTAAAPVIAAAAPALMGPRSAERPPVRLALGPAGD